MSPKWWDAGKSPYEPEDPFVNLNMIWIAAFTPFAFALFVGLLMLLANIFG